MKLLVLAVPVRLSYCMLSDSLNNLYGEYDLEALQPSDSYSSEQVFSLDPSFSQSASYDTIVESSSEPVQAAPNLTNIYQEEYYAQEGTLQQDHQYNSLVPGEISNPLWPSTIMAQPVAPQTVPIKNTRLNSTDLLFGYNTQPTQPPNAPYVTSSDLLFGKQQAQLPTRQTNFNRVRITPIQPDISSTSASQTWTTINFDNSVAASGNETQVPSRLATGNTNINPVRVTTIQPNISSTSTSQTWTTINLGNSILASSNGTEEKRAYKDLNSLPARLLAKVLNEVSILMGKNLIDVDGSVALILQTTLQRFEEILEILVQYDEQSLQCNYVDKAFVTASLHRLRTARLQVRGDRGETKMVYYVITDDDREDLTQTERFKTLAELLVRYTTPLYGKMLCVSFDSKGDLLVEGTLFPTAEEMKQFNKETYEKNRKRRLESSQEQPPAKRPKIITVSPFNAHCEAQKRKNLKLLVKLHNYVVEALNMHQIDDKQSLMSLTPHLRDSFIALVEVATKNKGKLTKTEIHNDHRITMKKLKEAKSYFCNEQIPSQRHAVWLLRAFRLSKIDGMNSATKLHKLANWYAAVAMATIGSIRNVRYENGVIFVDNQPILPFVEEQVSSQ